jgi:hypothetical protein
MIYNVPLNDQYVVEGDTYFKLRLPADAKLASGPSGYLPVTLLDIELNNKNLNAHSIKSLRAIVRYILNEDSTGLNKNKLVDLILKDIKLL